MATLDAGASTAPRPVDAGLRRAGKALAKHSGIVSLTLPVAALLLFVVRCTLLAHFNRDVTIDLIQLSDPVDVIRQGAMNLADLLILAAGFIGVALATETLNHNRSIRPIHIWLPAAAVALIAIALSTATLLAQGDPATALAGFGVVGAAVFLGLGGVEPIGEEGGKRPPTVFRKVGYVLGVGFAVVIVAGLIAGLLNLNTNAMWLPPEAVTIHGQKPVTLYVLQSDGDDLIVFDLDARSVQRINGKTVDDRQFCVDEYSPRKGMPTCP